MWQQFPPGRHKSIGIHTSGLVHGLQGALIRVAEHERPDDITIPLDDGVGSSKTVRLIGVQRRVDAAKDDRRSSIPCERPDLVSAKRVACVNPYAHHVARLHGVDVEGFQGFISDARQAV
jgi:hypothetical protein